MEGQSQAGAAGPGDSALSTVPHREGPQDEGQLSTEPHLCTLGSLHDMTSRAQRGLSPCRTPVRCSPLWHEQAPLDRGRRQAQPTAPEQEAQAGTQILPSPRPLAMDRVHQQIWGGANGGRKWGWLHSRMHEASVP